MRSLGKELCFKAKGFQNLKVLGLDMFDSLEAITVEEVLCERSRISHTLKISGTTVIIVFKEK
jgi:hypothetical protein